MRNVRSLLLSLPLVGMALLAPRAADACGACFVPPDESTQVTGHRMIFSTSMTQTTLYDQIEYVGSPESFSWVLPIHGQVDVGLSADAMFAFMGAQTTVQVLPPPQDCPPPPDNCYDYGYGAEDGAGGGGGSTQTGGGVTVITQEVVGPFETVQLSASDPLALQTWLSDHGYAIPDDIKPVIDAYQKEGFDFLAMKLVPGEGVSAMRPVRVTSQGAGLGLPLRMVAGGTGVLTPITLFVVAEGRYHAANFPNVELDPSTLVWHYDDSSSNYDVLVKELLKASDGMGWLTQSAAGPYDNNPADPYFIADGFVQQVQAVIENNPGQTDWGDPDKGVSELDDAKADLDTLFAGMKMDSVWLTRLHAQLSREALANDLQIEAEPTQKGVNRYLQAEHYDGTLPACPDYSWCGDSSQNGGNFDSHGQTDGPYAGGKGACSVQRTGKSDGPAALLAGIGLAAAAVALRRRRRAR